VQCGKGKVVKVTGIANQGRTATVLLRGGNKMVLEEAERSLHDALCVIRCLVQKRFLVTGGASPEVEVSYQLSKWSKTLQVGPGAGLAWVWGWAAVCCSGTSASCLVQKRFLVTGGPHQRWRCLTS
jgi:chaperonin GroEL (HSP60 family)